MASCVDNLTYELRWLGPDVRIVPQSQEVTLGEFECSVTGTILSARPQAAFETAAEAQAQLEPHLRRWELQVELETGRRMEFRLSSSHVVDRPAGVGGPAQHFVGVHDYMTISDSLSVAASSYLPPPPES